MRKTITLVLLFSAFHVFGQNDLTKDNITILKTLKIGTSTKLKGVSNDTASDLKRSDYLISESAAKNYTDSRPAKRVPTYMTSPFEPLNDSTFTWNFDEMIDSLTSRGWNQQGETGPQGPPGPAGATGPQGPAGPGSVVSVTGGYGLNGGTITTTGTLSIDTSITGLSGKYIRIADASSLVTATKDVLLMYILGQSNEGTDPSLGPLSIDSFPSYLKGTFSNVLIDTVINSAVYFTPLNTAGIGAGYLNQTLWRLSQSYKWVLVIKRSLGGTSLSPLTYPISDFVNYCSILKPSAHDIIDSLACDKMIFYGQCETDGSSLNAAVNYRTNFLNLMNNQVRPSAGPYWTLVKRINNMTRDFPFRSQVATGQDSVKLLYPNIYSYVNTDSLPMKSEGIKTGLTYNGDFSHYREETHLKIGDMVADSIETHFGKTKTDKTKPRFVRAYINTSGTALVVKFTKEMQSKSIPHTYAFTCGTKVFSSITVAGDSAIFIPTIPFYQSIVYTLSYSKDAQMKINLRDKYGNEVSNFLSMPIVNNCTIPSPTFSTIYTSNFTTLGSNPADLPNFWTAPTAGSTVTANSTSATGVTACAKFDMTPGSGFRFYKWQTAGMNTAGKIYQISFDIEVPRTYTATGAPNSQIIQIDNLDHSAVFEFSKLLRPDKMTRIEYQFTEGTPTNDDFYFEFGTNNTTTVYIKNVVIKSN